MSTYAPSVQEAEYLLGTHDAELSRLGLQHKLWSEAAFRCWEQAGIGPGATVLDVGCGPGYATWDLAALVAPTGRVVAVDESARFIDHLAQQVEALGMRNVEARVMDAHHLDVAPASIDAAYARWVLCYVSDPDAVIHSVARTLRPGGLFAIQDYIHVAGQMVAPPSTVFAHIAQTIEASWRHSGGDPNIGLRLPTLLQRHGLRVERIRPIQRIARPGSPLWLWPSTFYRNYVPLLVERGLLSADEQQAFEREWAALSADDAAYMWLPPVVEIIARKKDVSM